MKIPEHFSLFPSISVQALLPKHEPGSIYLIYTTLNKQRIVVRQTLSDGYEESITSIFLFTC
jgi:hypothetical protein